MIHTHHPHPDMAQAEDPYDIRTTINYEEVPGDNIALFRIVLLCLVMWAILPAAGYIAIRYGVSAGMQAAWEADRAAHPGEYME